MKTWKSYLIILLFALFSQQGKSQCNDSGIKGPPDERVIDRLKEGDIYGNPYTMFVREVGFNLDSTLSQIRNALMQGQPFKTNSSGLFSLYENLYLFANKNGYSACNVNDKDDCNHPAWVKANAIVYLIRLYPVYSGANVSFNLFGSDSADRYATRAFDGISDLESKVRNTGKTGNVRNKALQLMQYLQAYDLLKAGGKIAKYAEDASSDDCTPRNKLRQYSKELYVASNNVINSDLGWKKNHGIICASVLGMAAIVLNDAGVKKGVDDRFVRLLQSLWNAVTLNWSNIPHTRYNPISWWERAYGRSHNIICLKDCEDGLYDNFFIGYHFLGKETPMTNKEGSAGYAEGPGYFMDLSGAFLPFLRTADNYLSPDHSKNLLRNHSYINLLNWYRDLLINGNKIPSYDNSAYVNGNILGVLGSTDFPGNPTAVKESFVDLRGDYLLALGFNTGELKNNQSYANIESGNIYIKQENAKSNQTFLMLSETGVAVDKPATSSDETHEDDDLGAWSLFVQSKNSDGSLAGELYQLGIDPPYIDWSSVNATNEYYHHNTIEISPEEREYINPVFNWKYDPNNFKTKEFDLTYDWKGSYLVGNVFTRNVISFNTDSVIYYLFNDFLNGTGIDDDDFDHFTMFVNGLGHIPTFTGKTDTSYRKIENLNYWYFPCQGTNQTTNWSLVTHHTALKGGQSGTNLSITPYTYPANLNIGTLGGGLSDGYHTRLKVSQSTKKTIFQSFILPKLCGTPLPTIQKIDTLDFVATKIQFMNLIDTSFEGRLGKNPSNNLIKDTACHLHLVRWDGNVQDSLVNPFNLPSHSNQKLYFNFQKAFLNYHTTTYMGGGYKYCPPTYSNLREIRIEDGTYLIFKDTIVFSSKPITFNASIIGRQTYSCYISPNSTTSNADSIKIHLPDIGRGVDMVAIASNNDTIPGRYDSISNYFYMVIPSAKKEFTIQEKQACQDCYFPPLGTNIDTVFLADDGNRHTLGNKKTINYTNGCMVISNSTRISMCPGVYLNNKDSLIIEGPPQKKGTKVPTCQGIETITYGSNNSMLIVSSGSALVLNAGSRTIIKPGGAIYVKQNGSLVIKDGAFVQIGDSSKDGWGEIIAEAGAYIYIEPSAHIEYRRIIGDTVDRNLINFATGNLPAFAGVYYWMDSLLKAENIIDPIIYPIAICDLDSLNPISNKDWGYTNFAKPIANLTMRNDTLCPGEPLIIRMNRILNDAMAEIKVCRWDSIFDKNGFKFMQCVDDSIVLDSIPPDPICRLPRVLPDEWIYYFDVNTRHQISFKLMNECGKIVDTSFLVVVRDTPHFNLTIPATACEGYQTVKAMASNEFGDSIYYTFEISEEVDTTSINYQIGNPGIFYSRTFFGIIPDTFDFPGYYFRGGRKYNISLSITNSCGTSTQFKIVEIPTGVYIQLEKSTLYSNPINGARSVQLHGFVSSVDSFRWEPTTWLNRSDTLLVTSTPEDSIGYILIAHKDECVAYDTVSIKINHVANSGVGDTICFNNGKVLLGNAYDMSVFLGYLYYKGGNDFRNRFINKTTEDQTYFRNFSLFMQSQVFKDWANSCSTLYTDFTENLLREQTIHKNWYINYFENLTAFDNPPMNALDSFTYYISNDSVLNNNYSTVNDWGNIGNCMDGMLSNYEDFVNSQINSVNISWYKISGTDTSYNGSLQEAAIAVDAPDKTSTYIQNVITENYAEIDQTTIWVDTLASSNFRCQFQFDSTIVFENLTDPFNAGNTFAWNFGDGTTQNFEENPMHVFPKFDTAYKVCLIVTNNCGVSTFCDSVYLDSLHWGGTLYSRVNKQISNELTKNENRIIQVAIYPNPTLGIGYISYDFSGISTSGILLIMDSQGRIVFEKDLNNSKDQIKIPSDKLVPGMYYYLLRTLDGDHVTGKILRL